MMIWTIFCKTVTKFGRNYPASRGIFWVVHVTNLNDTAKLLSCCITSIFCTRKN